MRQKTIGILAGMGPKSTAPFINMVVDACQRLYGARDDIDFPPMMMYSLPTPFYIGRPIDHDSMKRTIIEGLRRLESTGVDLIAIPCNTAHLYFDDLQRSIRVPLLHIIDETLDRLPGEPCRTTFLGTPSTFEMGLYQDGIARKGHTFVFREEWQDAVNELIACIKTEPDDTRSAALWDALIRDVMDDSVQCAIIACTDLSVAAGETPGLAIVESSRCLAEAVVKKYLEKTG